MTQPSSYLQSLKVTGLVCLYSLSGASIAVDGNNPWLEPRVGPAESRQMSTDQNTWSDSTGSKTDDADSSKFPPMDEDAALGLEPAQMPATAAIPDSPASIEPSVGAGAPSYPPTTGGFGQRPVYPAPNAGYSGQYRKYPGTRYPKYRKGSSRGWPGNSGGFWPGSSGGFWPGNSGGSWPGSSGGFWPGYPSGGGFPFGGSNWMPFDDW